MDWPWPGAAALANQIEGALRKQIKKHFSRANICPNRRVTFASPLDTALKL